MFQPRHGLLGLSVLCLSLITACGISPEQEQHIQTARQAYEAANTNALVAATPQAQVHLQAAREALAKVESAEKAEQWTHYSAMAVDKSNIAIDLAKRKTAEKDSEKLNREKQDVLIEARERETAKALALAKSSALKAEAKAREAEARAREAEMATERAERESERARQLEQQLKDLQAQQTERGLVLTLGDVLFSSGKSSLLPGAASNLDKLAEFLASNAERKVMIEGHTDNVGSAESNMSLSQNRANSVRNALLERGIASERLSTNGFGESKPATSNDTAGGRQQNRRVEIIILK